MFKAIVGGLSSAVHGFPRFEMLRDFPLALEPIPGSRIAARRNRLLGSTRFPHDGDAFCEDERGMHALRKAGN